MMTRNPLVNQNGNEDHVAIFFLFFANMSQLVNDPQYLKLAIRTKMFVRRFHRAISSSRTMGSRMRCVIHSETVCELHGGPFVCGT